VITGDPASFPDAFMEFRMTVTPPNAPQANSQKRVGSVFQKGSATQLDPVYEQASDGSSVTGGGNRKNQSNELRQYKMEAKLA